MTAIQSGELLDQIFPTKLGRTDHIVTFTNALVNFKINLVKPPEKITIYFLIINYISLLKALKLNTSNS